MNLELRCLHIALRPNTEVRALHWVQEAGCFLKISRADYPVGLAVSVIVHIDCLDLFGNGLALFDRHDDRGVSYENRDDVPCCAEVWTGGQVQKKLGVLVDARAADMTAGAFLVAFDCAEELASLEYPQSQRPNRK